ncbi:MAG: 16S rRNA (cytosine(1402)-N(4))-methyltransferase RsmH [Phycisphaerae bacterium]|nr:16S rRNA (cytosine(1402)-N(4))-methyltransferase RsmH [Phycisphaerae bacterium]
MSSDSADHSHSQHNSDRPHRRRQRYSGSHPRRFEHRYKEHAPQAYPGIVEQVRARGGTPAGTHIPVLVDEIMAALRPAPGELVADCTLGYGGHTEVFLDRIAPTGRVWAFDVDAASMQRTKERLAPKAGDRIRYHRSNFAGIGKVLGEAGIDGFDVILADLGVSSMQVDMPDRGFSYKFDGPLDMRMDDRIPRSAADLLMTLSTEQIAQALDEFADEPDAIGIAQQIVQSRDRQPIRTTQQLTRLIFEVKRITPNQWRKRAKERQNELHPAARTFQALRILVNDELGSLRSLLRVVPSCLRPGGRIGIISFHSGEDRLVERSFNECRLSGIYEEVSTEPIRPSGRERFDNPRSASAKFRWARRVMA